MITVSKNQFEALEPEFIKPFLNKVQNIVQESCAQSIKDMTAEQIYAQVEDGYQLSKHFGIKTERGIIRFICLTFLLGKKFYTQKDFIPLFNSRNNKIDKDIDELYRQLDIQFKK